tara:strand:- start:108 stop:965 length:858 start_codon:yes stop_codon:yes gene_type:complete
MSSDEISRLTKALSELGVTKIRLTGGEPTVRKDFFDILKDMKLNSNIPKVTMTTNGYQLNKIAKQLYEVGLDGINISIDSLDREIFKKLTGHDRLTEILDGIKILQKLNFKNIKVNAVLLKGVNDTNKDFEKFGNFIKENKINFRFIELMQTGDNLNYFNKNHVSSKVFKDYLEKNNWVYQTNGKDAGPALNYIHPEYSGKFGLIAPYSKGFCKTCNRLRITSRGDLRLCLFGNTGISIRHLLQNDDQKKNLIDLIIKQLHLKKESHYLELGDTGITPNLSSTGG